MVFIRPARLALFLFAFPFYNKVKIQVVLNPFILSFRLQFRSLLLTLTHRRSIGQSTSFCVSGFVTPTIVPHSKPENKDDSSSRGSVLHTHICLPAVTMAIDIGPVLVEKPAVVPISLKTAAPVAVPVAPVSESKPEIATHLVISPYTDHDHLLDLRTVSIQEQLLAYALIKMKSLREDYATAPYIDTFNWAEVVEDLRERAKAIGHSWTEQAFYIVAFRSQVPPTTDYSNLGALDKAAHIEAVQSGGFLK